MALMETQIRNVDRRRDLSEPGLKLSSPLTIPFSSQGLSAYGIDLCAFGNSVSNRDGSGQGCGRGCPGDGAVCRFKEMAALPWGE